MTLNGFLILLIIMLYPISIILIIAKGGNYQSWMSYSKAEKRALKNARRDLGEYNIKKYSNEERGTLYYKGRWWNISGHSGLSLYENCIRANFVFNRTGQYETRSYDEINRITQINSYIEGLFNTSWEMLQLDTVDYKTCLVDFRNHPKEKILDILQERFGHRWFEIYGGVKGMNAFDSGHHHILDEV